MSFKIVITDNENGKELVNENNVKAIIGAFTDGENTAQMVFSKCNMKDLIFTTIGAKKQFPKQKTKTPQSVFSQKWENFSKILWRIKNNERKRNCND